MLKTRLKHHLTHEGREQGERKTFVFGHNGDRLLLFTPEKYDAFTGLLHGTDQSERPMARFLEPYEPPRLEWDDE